MSLAIARFGRCRTGSSRGHRTIVFLECERTVRTGEPPAPAGTPDCPDHSPYCPRQAAATARYRRLWQTPAYGRSHATLPNDARTSLPKRNGDRRRSHTIRLAAAMLPCYPAARNRHCRKQLVQPAAQCRNGIHPAPRTPADCSDPPNTSAPPMACPRTRAR